jgi:hypothetical protein
MDGRALVFSHLTTVFNYIEEKTLSLTNLSRFKLHNCWPDPFHLRRNRGDVRSEEKLRIHVSSLPVVLCLGFFVLVIGTNETLGGREGY